ncbi:RrF2 family transcriptional regulator [Metabacillus herbersteinensis]|uniref:RrF2 family transcriptional regulator n=1 Tax=Metabacillus herbersteinensis TaxID=283816 RepID=A0ABV6GH77_9BACI
MKFSKATNYALHTLVHLATVPKGKAIGVKPLAQLQGLSQAYLSKILATLVKGNLIESSPGVDGGYKLRKEASEITFLQVIELIEGRHTMFQCDVNHPTESADCLIQQVMDGAEQKLKYYLTTKTIQDIAAKVEHDGEKHITSRT